MRNIYVCCLIAFTFLNCQEDSTVEAEIAKVDVDFVVERFDLVFSKAQPQDLGQLKATFPFLFAKRIPDSVWINRMNDTLQQQLFQAVDKQFGDFKDARQELSRLFQHLKYYDKSFSMPRVVTLTNDVDYRYPVIVTDSLALLALDNYLGSDHEFYGNIPEYITANMTKDQLVVDLADEYGKRVIFPNEKKNFLEEMVFFGKALYFKDKVIPFKSDFEKMGYTQSQLEFAKVNENMIWTHFVQNEMLFSNDNSLVSRFIAEAPFSKFYMDIDNQTPGRLGQYVGWQIVRAYMNNNDVGLIELMETDPMEIFNKSNYKPSK
ncbi:gliding motility lipoprotein GldB [Sediminibacter sp. Hel_I_10]|uniref:gliding motility lipoprotein GldB n=1 Tax=Sediminibacter sp. Hel_I_10 TaxID=1392490 RepID=UPI00047C1E4F|nr:gliding motility lipoprotein GldB [Sediminibacter sp. Hel_I_10]